MSINNLEFNLLIIDLIVICNSYCEPLLLFYLTASAITIASVKTIMQINEINKNFHENKNIINLSHPLEDYHLFFIRKKLILLSKHI